MTLSGNAYTGRETTLNASAFVVGPRDGASAALQDLAHALGFMPVERYAGLIRAEKQVKLTPLMFFLCAEVANVNAELRFSPLIYFSRQMSVDTIKACIKMGFDDVIAMPYTGADLSERIFRQVGRTHTYYETATYFGPDRRNRVGDPRSPDSDHGGGQFRRIEIVRSPETGVNVLRDDFQVVV
jgi:hypothetical protein